MLNPLTRYLTADSEFYISYDFTSRDSSSTMGSSEITEPTSLTFHVLQEITDNFSEERAVGQGAYGKVYKVRVTQSSLVSSCEVLPRFLYSRRGWREIYTQLRTRSDPLRL
jgi:hypothetical protein